MADGRSWSAKVRIYRAQHLADAQLVQDLLEQDGIPVETRGISLMGLAGGIPIADAMPTLWVVPHNVDRAQALIAALEQPTEASPWTCGCGEDNDATFGSCWSCGRDRPDLMNRLSPERLPGSSSEPPPEG
jgi:hypothetical protein